MLTVRTPYQVDGYTDIGNILKETPRNTGTRPVGGDRFSGGTVMLPPENVPTLAELGIDKRLY
jgi:hypothetical protein